MSEQIPSSIFVPDKFNEIKYWSCAEAKNDLNPSRSRVEFLKFIWTRVLVKNKFERLEKN